MFNLWWIIIGFGLIAVISGIIITVEVIFSKSLEEMFSKKVIIIFKIGLFASCITIALIVVTKTIMFYVDGKQKDFFETRSQVLYGDYESLNDIKKVELINKIIDANNWLEQAKESNARYGNWSIYCNINVDALEYITLS